MKLTKECLRKLIKECINEYVKCDSLFEVKGTVGSGNPWHDTEGEWTDPDKTRGSYSYAGKKRKRKSVGRKTSATKTPCGRHPAKYKCKSGELKESEDEFEYPIKTNAEGEWYERLDDKLGAQIDAEQDGWGDVLSTVIKNYNQVDQPDVDGEIVCVRADSINKILIGKNKDDKHRSPMTRNKIKTIVQESVDEVRNK